MTLRKSSFIKNYKRKAVSANLNNIHDAVRYAFMLTDKYGIIKIDRAISEASMKYNVDENILRSTYFRLCNTRYYLAFIYIYVTLVLLLFVEFWPYS